MSISFQAYVYLGTMALVRAQAVLTEVVTMASVSTKCCHRPPPGTNSITYERCPSDPRKIVSQLDLMNVNMTSDTCANAKTRSNMVASSIAGVTRGTCRSCLVYLPRASQGKKLVFH